LLLKVSLFLLFVSQVFGVSIGVIEKGKMDRFENALALVTRGDKVLSIDKVGFKIRRNDTIKTFRRSTLQIRLTDNTIIKIGKKTTFKVEEYLYNNQSKSKSVVNLKIENGTFQIKTGKIGDNAPRNFKIKTKFSTIGLRG
jgi:hypothetical protein